MAGVSYERIMEEYMTVFRLYIHHAATMSCVIRDASAHLVTSIVNSRVEGDAVFLKVQFMTPAQRADSEAVAKMDPANISLPIASVSEEREPLEDLRGYRERVGGAAW